MTEMPQLRIDDQSYQRSTVAEKSRGYYSQHLQPVTINNNLSILNLNIGQNKEKAKKSDTSSKKQSAQLNQKITNNRNSQNRISQRSFREKRTKQQMQTNQRNFPSLTEQDGTKANDSKPKPVFLQKRSLQHLSDPRGQITGGNGNDIKIFVQDSKETSAPKAQHKAYCFVKGQMKAKAKRNGQLQSTPCLPNTQQECQCEVPQQARDQALGRSKIQQKQQIVKGQITPQGRVSNHFEGIESIQSNKQDSKNAQKKQAKLPVGIMKQPSAELQHNIDGSRRFFDKNQIYSQKQLPSMNNTQNSGPETTPSEMFQNLDRLWQNKDNFSSHDIIESSKNATFGQQTSVNQSQMPAVKSSDSRQHIKKKQARNQHKHSRSVSPTPDDKQFFVLRAKGKELLVQMLDKSEQSLQNLRILKSKDGNSADRPMHIKKFIKDQLSSGNSAIYAYKDKVQNVWIRVKDQEIDQMRRSLSSSVSRERDCPDNLKSFSRETSVEIQNVEQTEEVRGINFPLPARGRPQTRGVLKNYCPMDSIVEENRTAEKQPRPLSHYNAPVVIRDLLAGKVSLPQQHTRSSYLHQIPFDLNISHTLSHDTTHAQMYKRKTNLPKSANQTQTNTFQKNVNTQGLLEQQKPPRPQSTIAEKHQQIFNTSNRRYQDFYNDELRSQKHQFLNASSKSKESFESIELQRRTRNTVKPSFLTDQQTQKRTFEHDEQRPTMIIDTEEQDSQKVKSGISQEILYLTKDDEYDLIASARDHQDNEVQHEAPDITKLEQVQAKLYQEVQQACKMRDLLDQRLVESMDACKHGQITQQQVDRVCHEVNVKISEYLKVINGN